MEHLGKQVIGCMSWSITRPTADKGLGAAAGERECEGGARVVGGIVQENVASVRDQATYCLSLAKEWHSILAGMECAIPFWPE